MVFGLKESIKVEDCENNEILLVDSLFHAVKRVSKCSSKYVSPGKWSQNKVRLITMIFKQLEEKKVFISSLYKLKTEST